MHYMGMKFCRIVSNTPGHCCRPTMKQAAWILASRSRGAWIMYFRALYPYHKRPPLWSRGNIIASHGADPGPNPGWVNFLVEIFSRFFLWNLTKMSENLGHIRPRVSYDHHISSKPYSSVYGRWRSLAIYVVHDSLNNKQQKLCKSLLYSKINFTDVRN